MLLLFFHDFIWKFCQLRHISIWYRLLISKTHCSQIVDLERTYYTFPVNCTSLHVYFAMYNFKVYSFIRFNEFIDESINQCIFNVWIIVAIKDGCRLPCGLLDSKDAAICIFWFVWLLEVMPKTMIMIFSSYHPKSESNFYCSLRRIIWCYWRKINELFLVSLFVLKLQIENNSDFSN